MMRTVGALLVDATVRDGEIHVVDPGYKTRRQHWATRVGEGVRLKIRIEPEADAWRHADAKHLYGHLYGPVSTRHGETVAEVHLRMKAAYMPDDGRTSITELNRDEMKAYIESVEQEIREHDPESWDDCVAVMALWDR